MNDLLASLVPVLGRALLNFVWQGGVIGLLASIALFHLRHARAQSRYLVMCLALLTCLLAPVIDLMVQLGSSSAGYVPSSPATGEPSGPVVRAAAFAVIAGPAHGDAWATTVVAAWAAGACALCLRMALGVAWVGRLRATPQPPSQARWQQRLDRLAARLGVTRRVALRLVDGLDSPVAAGWLRPVVLLPTALVARMPVELVEALLAHELAHVRRHDYLVNLVQGVVEALLFYHPVVWWLSRQARIEREQIADGLAARAIDSPRTLAVALAALSELQPTGAAPPRLAQAAHGGHLMSRIELLVRPGRRVAGARVAYPLLGIATACLAFYAQARIATDAPSTQGEPRPAPATHPAVVAPQPAAAVVRPLPLPQPAPFTGHGPGVRALPPVTPAAMAAPVAGTAQPDSDDDRDGYALVRRDRPGITRSGTAPDSQAVAAMRGGQNRDFLWARRDGREYLITDPALVARASRAWQDDESLGREMKALAARMEPHRDTMKALGAEMGQLAGRIGPTPEMRAAQRRIGVLAREQGRLAARQAGHSVRLAGAGEPDEARLEAEMEAMEARIEAEMEALEARIEREAERIEAEAGRIAHRSEPMEALARRMEDAARPMEAIGEQMDALGERHARVAEQADLETQAMIREAIERGLARPASPARP